MIVVWDTAKELSHSSQALTNYSFPIKNKISSDASKTYY